jgi:hypothetical protein
MLGFKLIKFHEFWWICVLQELNRKIGINMERISSRHDYLRKPHGHRHWKTLEDARRHPNGDRVEVPTRGPASPTHRSSGLVPPGSDLPFPLFKVGLIRGLRFIPLGYKTRPRPPSRELINQFIISQGCPLEGQP